MASSVQARLDRESVRALQHMVTNLGWTPSQAVREGLRLLAACHRQPAGQKIIGAGRFASGVRDLGSNKRHLKDFGR